MPGFTAAIEEFLEHLAVIRGCTKHTVRAYRRDLEMFKFFLARL